MNEINKLEDIKVNPYQSILYLEHPTSLRHPRMSLLNRAGQFAPFAALTGFDDKIKEVQRLTSKKILLDDSYQEELDQKLFYLESKQFQEPVKVTYFVKDKRKEGGKYIEKVGCIQKIDSCQKKMIFQDKEKITISDIVNIEILDLSNEDNLL